jgi:hypothetical protein
MADGFFVHQNSSASATVSFLANGQLAWASYILVLLGLALSG